MIVSPRQLVSPKMHVRGVCDVIIHVNNHSTCSGYVGKKFVIGASYSSMSMMILLLSSFLRNLISHFSRASPG